MKPTKYLTLLTCLTGALGSGFAVAQSSVGYVNVPTANRLAGWNNFAAPGTGNTAAQVLPGFQATSSLAGATGYGPVGTHGNSDIVYGDSDWSGVSLQTPGPPVDIYNGAVTLGGTNTFTLKNLSAPATLIDYLLFDLQKVGATNPSVKVTYSGGYSGTIANAISVGNNSDDYADYTYDLSSLNIWLAPGQSISFDFGLNNANLARLDNVAIAGSPIPEPGSILAIGCFLGSGLLIRRNRRTIA
jgi:hypothetical protein